MFFLKQCFWLRRENVISKKKKKRERGWRPIALWEKKWWFSLSDFLGPTTWACGIACDTFLPQPHNFMNVQSPNNEINYHSRWKEGGTFEGKNISLETLWETKAFTTFTGIEPLKEKCPVPFTQKSRSLCPHRMRWRQFILAHIKGLMGVEGEPEFEARNHWRDLSKEEIWPDLSSLLLELFSSPDFWWQGERDLELGSMEPGRLVRGSEMIVHSHSVHPWSLTVSSLSSFLLSLSFMSLLI